MIWWIKLWMAPAFAQPDITLECDGYGYCRSASRPA